MGREIKRVPLDFDWPESQVWHGYLRPDELDEDECPACGGSGYSAHAQYLRDLWYGHAPFRPEDNGSTPLTSDTPAVRAFAERNIAAWPGYYGSGEKAVAREATRLADLWNAMWCHHLNDADVAVLIEGGRLMDFTHTFTPETRWQARDPLPIVTAAEVNEWSLRGFGHDAINASIAVRARCEREGAVVECSACEGHGSTEAYPGQRAEAEAWEATEPPIGEGWQMWETVSEGSPVSPVFGSAEGLAQWLTTPEGGEMAGPSRRPMTIEQARGFVGAGWAPSFIGNAGGLHDGATYVGTEEALGTTGGELR